MRFRELHIENFGLHQERRFTLEPGLQLIYGPNEAGKSTLLSLVRDLLFGFHDKTPYLYQNRKQPLAATVHFELQDGRQGWFRRQKGRPDTIAGELQGTPLDAAGLLQLLTGASRPLYERIFAFDQQELARDVDSLSDSDLREALFGGGIGGLATFRAVEQRIAAQLKELFNPRGRTQPINALLDQLRTTRQQYLASQVRPVQYEELQVQRQEICDREARYREQIVDLRREREHLKALRTARGVWLDWSAADCDRAAQQVTPLVTSDVICEYHRLTSERQTLAVQLDQLQAEAAQAEPVPSLTPEETALLAAETEIRRLDRELTHQQDLSERLAQWRREIVTLAAELEGDEAFEGASLTVAHREMARRLVDIDRRLTSRETRLQARREELEARHRLLQPHPGDGAPLPSALSAWEDLLDRARIWSDEQRRLAELQSSLAASERELELLAQQLLAPLAAPIGLSESLPVPLPATIREFQTQLDRLTSRLQRAAERSDETCESLRLARTALADWDRTAAVDPRQRLVQLRVHRDTGWRLIRRRYLESPDPEQQAALDRDIAEWTQQRPADFADLYESAVANADRQGDAAQADAEWQAQRRQRLEAIEQLESRLEEVQEEVELARLALQDQEELWQRQWQAAGIVPASPAAMLQWLERFEAWQRLRVEASHRRDEVAGLAERVVAFETELARSLPDRPASAAGVLKHIERRIVEIRRHEDELQRRQQEQADLAQQLERLATEERQAAIERGAWRQQFRHLQSELGLPDAWEIDVVARVLESWDGHLQRRRRLVERQREIDEAEADLGEFLARTKTVCRAAAMDLLAFPPLEAAEELARRLRTAELKRQRMTELQSAAASNENLQRLRRSQLETADAQLGELCRRVQLDGPAALGAAVARAEEANRLATRMQECERSLRTVLGERWREHQEELQELTDEAAALREQMLRDELEQLERALQQEVEARGEIDGRLRSLSQDSRSLVLGAHIEALRGRLVEEVEQWAPLALTQALMRRALSRFEQQHQPRLLADVSRYLERMTQGEYVALRRTLDQDGRLVVQHRDQGEKTPAQLSTGTREQLYLAIRLAFVADYCRHGEPLPVVMDDVLVNFDEERARRTLEVLAELAGQAQVLLLTCHRRTLELSREVQPEASVLILSSGREFPVPRANERDGGSGTAASGTDEPAAPRSSRRRRSSDRERRMLFPPG